MAELPEPAADVKVKTEEAPAAYDGPGALNEPPPSVTEAAPPPPPPADEQTPQVAQQTPVAMTPEQAAAAYAALVDACAKGGDAAAARGVLAEMRRAGVAPNAPVWTGLMQAHLAAGDPPEAVTAVLREMEAVPPSTHRP